MNLAAMRRVLGIDYGERRIGIAVSDPLGIIARGIGVIKNSPAMMDEIKHFVREYDPEKIVVGMPFNLKGEKGQKAQEVEEFIRQLRVEFEIEVLHADERFTSQIAENTLLQMGVKKKGRQSKGVIDQMAAALILQGYLNDQSGR